MSNMKPKYLPVSHVIFDMDGLLLNTVPIYNDIMRTIVVRQGYKFTDKLRYSLRGRNRRDCAQLIVSHCDCSLTVEACLDQLSKQHDGKLANCKLMPGAERLIRHLYRYGYPMAIGTSSSVQSVALKSKGHEQLLSLIHHIVCGTDDPRVNKGKPAPDIFLVAAEQFDEPRPHPSSCLVFEDALNGVQAARAAGMQVVYVTDSLESPAETLRTADVDVCLQERQQQSSGVLVTDSLLNFRPELFGLPPFDVKPY